MLTQAITAEIAQAIRKLGGNPEGVNLADTWQVNRVLEFLGADIYLLATVGSWGDTLTDEQVLNSYANGTVADRWHRTPHLLNDAGVS